MGNAENQVINENEANNNSVVDEKHSKTEENNKITNLETKQSSSKSTKSSSKSNKKSKKDPKENTKSHNEPLTEIEQKTFAKCKKAMRPMKKQLKMLSSIQSQSMKGIPNDQ